MRMLKKVMTGMSLTVAALAIACGSTTNVKAANYANDEESGEVVHINGAEQNMWITTTSDEVWISYDAIKEAKTGALSLNAKAKWDVYDVVWDDDSGRVIVDLSALKTTKNAYIAIKDETTDIPIVYKIPAHAEKLSGKYKIDKNGVGYLEFFENKNTAINELELKDGALVATTDPDEGYACWSVKYGYDQDQEKEKAGEYRRLEYRTVNSNTWIPYDAATFDASLYAKQGATLYFRYAGGQFYDPGDEEGGSYLNFSGVVYDNYDASKLKDDEEYTWPDAETQYGLRTITVEDEEEETEDGGRFAGAEIKIKIGKEAAAPTATIDYDNGAFKVKKNTEYRHIVKVDNEGIETFYAKMRTYIAEELGDTEMILNDNGYTYESLEGEEDSGAWTKNTTNNTLSVPIDITVDGIFEVRNSFTANKKVASKVGIYAYKAAPVLYSEAVEVEEPEGTPSDDLGIWEYDETLEEPDWVLRHVLTKDETPINNSNLVNIDFKNKSDTFTYLIYNGKPVATSKPIATVKPGKTVTAKKLDPATTILYVRSASDKKNGFFRSNAYKWTIEAASEDDI